MKRSFSPKQRKKPRKNTRHDHITWRPRAFKTITFGIMWCDHFYPNLQFEVVDVVFTSGDGCWLPILGAEKGSRQIEDSSCKKVKSRTVAAKRSNRNWAISTFFGSSWAAPTFAAFSGLGNSCFHLLQSVPPRSDRTAIMSVPNQGIVYRLWPFLKIFLGNSWRLLALQYMKVQNYRRAVYRPEVVLGIV